MNEKRAFRPLHLDEWKIGAHQIEYGAQHKAIIHCQLSSYDVCQCSGD